MKLDRNRRHIAVQRQNVRGAWVDVGYILLQDGELPGGFRYSDHYHGPPLSPDLDYRNTASLDPRFFAISTSNRMHTRAVDRPDLHSVFAESLPGRWGETVMASHAPSYAKSSPAEKLWMLGDRLAGGLRFEAGGGSNAEAWIEGEQALLALRSQVQVFIGKLAQRMRPEPLGSTTQRWALTSNGGQTPKCAFVRDGVEYVAKFSTTFLGTVETTRIERGMSHVSALAGLDTADSTLVEIEDGDAVLLSRRFDLDENGRRIHKINGATALGLPIEVQADYTDLVDWIRRHSTEPETDVRELYGRALLNVFCNNTDDHLGQFEFLADGDGWRLAPNFDVLVDELEADGTRRPHAMRIAGDAIVPSIDETWVEEVAEAFGIDPAEGRSIAFRVADAMERLPDIMRSYGVPDETVERYVMPAVGTDQIAALRQRLASHPTQLNQDTATLTP